MTLKRNLSDSEKLRSPRASKLYMSYLSSSSKAVPNSHLYRLQV